MLVLTRKANEEILIADNIRIVIIRLKNGSVQIGIDAPREINVCRGELSAVAVTNKQPEPVGS